jgi:hypothetical protein
VTLNFCTEKAPCRQVFVDFGFEVGGMERRATFGSVRRHSLSGSYDSDDADSCASAESKEYRDEVNYYRKVMGMPELVTQESNHLEQKRVQHNYSFSKRKHGNSSSFNENSFRKIRDSIKDFKASEKLRIYKACVLLRDAFDGRGHQGMFYLLKATGKLQVFEEPKTGRDISGANRGVRCCTLMLSCFSAC